MYRELHNNRFTNCNKTKEYFDLCNSDDNEELMDEHHILPKSMFPEYANSKWNIVRLSYKNHYKAHDLLPYICTEPSDKRKMLNAWWFTSHTRDGSFVDANTYELLRTDYVNSLKGLIWSEETRAKLSAAKKGKRPNNADTPKSKETRRKMSEAHSGENHPMYGKHHTDEAKNKISTAKKGAGSYNFGKKLSDETKRKMSEAQKGRVMLEETKRKLSEALKGRKASEATKLKLSNAKKGKPLTASHKLSMSIARKNTLARKARPIFCKTLDLTFESVSNLADYLLVEGYTKSRRSATAKINQVCNKTMSAVYGLVFEWVDNLEN